MNESKLLTSIDNLERALEYKERAYSDSVFYGAIAKAFEVAIEYAWKYFRYAATEAGFDVVAPRDAIKRAGALELIDDVDAWLRFLKIRNIAVHDYIGIKPKEYIKEAEMLLEKLTELKSKI